MNLIKKNQVIIYAFSLLLVVAGYLNYTNNIKEEAVETSSEEMVADIGDATLVNSNDVVQEQKNDSVNELENQNKVESNNANNNVNTNTQIDNKLNNESKVTSTNTTIANKEDYFTKSKLDRDNMYSQMIETYENILNGSNSLETQKQSASQEITKINEIKNSIMICENLIKTKGFENSVVFVNGDSVSVIVKAESLKKEETAQIQNIISRELKVKIENIHISTK